MLRRSLLLLNLILFQFLKNFLLLFQKSCDTVILNPQLRNLLTRVDLLTILIRIIHKVADMCKEIELVLVRLLRMLLQLRQLLVQHWWGCSERLLELMLHCHRLLLNTILSGCLSQKSLLLLLEIEQMMRILDSSKTSCWCIRVHHLGRKTSWP